jgi:hypothetical protein
MRIIYIYDVFGRFLIVFVKCDMDCVTAYL